MIIDILWGTIKRWKLNGCKTDLTPQVMEKLNWFIEKEVSSNEKSSNSR
jgi:hypothetical protein